MSEHKLVFFGIISVLALLSFDGEARLLPTISLISCCQIWLRNSFVSQEEFVLRVISANLFLL